MIDLKYLYRRAGFITGPLVDSGVVTGLRQDADQLIEQATLMQCSDGDFNLEAEDGGFHTQHHQAAGTSTMVGVLRKVSNVVAHSPAAEQVAARQDLRQLAATFTGSGTQAECVQLVHSILWCKPPGVGSPKPPHQDAAYLEGDPEQYVTFWIALDDCDATNGCLQVVPTSHRHTFAHGGSEPQIAADLWGALSRMDVPLQPGWGIVFHPRLLHASAVNTSTRPRRALMLRYRTR